MGWEYLHWTDLTLTKLMEVVIFQDLSYQNQFVANIDVFEIPQKTSKNTQHGPTAENIFFANQGPLYSPKGPISS